MSPRRRAPGAAPLARAACRRLCRWGPTAERRDDLALFRCAGCGSEWVRTEAWAPVDADGGRHPALAREVAARGGAPSGRGRGGGRGRR